MSHQRKKYNGMVVGVFLYLLLSSLHPLPSFAQTTTGSIDLSISTIPTDPKPLETVMLEVRSYGANLNLATVSWTYGGKAIAAGTGATRVQVTAPASGGSALATVTVSGLGMQNASASILLRPASIDLLWQAVDSYTPPFYKGKALLSRSGAFKVVAIPAAAAPAGLSYSWSRNDSVLQAASGYQKSSITLLNTILNNVENIAVSASGGLFDGAGALPLAPQAPTVVAYRKKEGFIDYANGAASSMTVASSGVTVRFEPYFFSTPRGILNDLAFDMRFGEERVYGSPANELSLSRPATGGQSIMTLGVSTNAYSLQNVTKQFSILFN